MVILFIVGLAVEEALGKRRYLVFYLLAGLGAGVFDLVFNASRTAPGIGASGAISGVMAMFVALYGLRKIRFFYWALVYFDFFRAPAIIVLPWWIANELYQYLFNHESMVNYVAHLSGFVTGTVLIAGLRSFGKSRVVAPEPEAAIDPLPGELSRVDALLGALRIDEALKALRHLTEAHPHELPVVFRYYKVARNNARQRGLPPRCGTRLCLARSDTGRRRPVTRDLRRVSENCPADGTLQRPPVDLADPAPGSQRPRPMTPSG